MLFDDAGAKGDRRDGRRHAGSVVRQARHAVEVFGQARDHPQIGVLEPGRISADAVEQGNVGAGASGGVDGFDNFLRAGHAGRDDQGHARLRRTADQRQVDSLEGRDLERRRPQLLQQVHSGLVERGREGDYAPVRRPPEQGLVPLKGCRGLRIKLIEAAPGPQALFDDEAGAPVVDGDGLGCVGLQLDGVRPGLRRRVDQRQSALDPAVVIARQLGDDERRLGGADPAACNGEVGGHGSFRGRSTQHRPRPLTYCLAPGRGP